jgi:tripartite-type tricarboxylate transporter receptor subunit TctC
MGVMVRSMRARLKGRPAMTVQMKRFLLSTIASIAAALAVPGPASAQPAFPSKPIHWVVPFAAGGATDVIARMVGQKLSEGWGQPVIIDNKPGGTGVVGSEAVKNAPPDGYTILMGTASTHSVSPAVHPKLSYRLEDFTPATLVATFPNMLVVHPSMPVKTVPEFIALLKANPNRYNFSSTGPGGSVHLAAELFMQMTGTKMTHVAYKGSAPALNDLLGGQVDCTFDNMTTVWPHVQSGSLRALGVAGLQRVKAAPDVPTIAETVPGYEATSWVGIFGPRGMPDDIASRYATEVARIVSAADLNKRLEELGAAGEADSPTEFKRFVAADTDKWRKVVETAGVVLDE